MSDSWTSRYHGRDTALLVDGGQIEEVPILRVLKSQVIVERDGEQLRYAADSTSRNCFQRALRTTSGQMLYGRNPILALLGDYLVRITEEENEEREVCGRKVRALRRRLDPLYEAADLEALERVAVALDQPREKLHDDDTLGRHLRGLLGGDASLSEAQSVVYRALRRELRRREAAAKEAGFRTGKSLLMRPCRWHVHAGNERVGCAT